MKVTFHRAIDMTIDPVKAVYDVIRSDCDKILSSGGAATALEGVDTLRKMSEVAESRIDIIAAAGISETNVVSILQVCCSMIELPVIQFRVTVKSEQKKL